MVTALEDFEHKLIQLTATEEQKKEMPKAFTEYLSEHQDTLDLEGYVKIMNLLDTHSDVLQEQSKEDYQKMVLQSSKDIIRSLIEQGDEIQLDEQGQIIENIGYMLGKADLTEDLISDDLDKYLRYKEQEAQKVAEDISAVYKKQFLIKPSEENISTQMNVLHGMVQHSMPDFYLEPELSERAKRCFPELLTGARRMELAIPIVEHILDSDNFLSNDNYKKFVTRLSDYGEYRPEMKERLEGVVERKKESIATSAAEIVESTQGLDYEEARSRLELLSKQVTSFKLEGELYNKAANALAKQMMDAGLDVSHDHKEIKTELKRYSDVFPDIALIQDSHDRLTKKQRDSLVKTKASALAVMQDTGASNFLPGGTSKNSQGHKSSKVVPGQKQSSTVKKIYY